ncbi:hypothetical protein SAMN02799630_04327 [Paenibacillus sp. UNCCL117]|uniref:hypothetical protein n=1 Tax=unclassified Paenibacillus TaxID=185978 RepID=UPI00088DEAB9|nr:MULTISPECIES: hypothetical protein [unclassified Paenibacillus]SDD97378.1 hypothetical protein SAMN04488602_11667 [Paenibacillus sp. cl123]SFW56211.1 hypothetical protein SAMN02799630_04327 [Paenibacillus sp. UNCCL117]
MSYLLELNIAEHRLAVEFPSDTLCSWAVRTFSAVPATSYTFASPIDMLVSVEMGYGRAWDARLPRIVFTADRVWYSRSDLQLSASRDYAEATIDAYDEAALEHALMVLYNALITQREWGLLVRASSVAEGNKASLFMLPADHPDTKRLPQQSGALLADEAAVLKVSGGQVRVFNSPFRQGICRQPQDIHLTYDVGAYYLQRTAPLHHHSPMSRTDAVLQLHSSLLLKPLDPSDTSKTIAMCRKATDKIPFYELYAPTDWLWERDVVGTAGMPSKRLQHG